MKKEFREFYNKEKINFKNLDDSVLIVLDTNVLLHIFRFSISSRKKLINSLKKVEGNLWIPYHVGLEYNLHKVTLISKMRDSKENLQKEIDRDVKKLKNTVFEKIDNIGIKSSDEREIRKGIKDNFAERLDNLLTEWKSNELIKEFDLIGNVKDESDKIADIFNDKVGKQFTQEQITNIENEAESRYTYEFPPGYKDESDKGKTIRKYGNVVYHEKYSDLIIWKQLIEKAKGEDKINKVIFVTDDEKQDWQYTVNGQKKGPRAELKKELLDEANADLYIFNTNSFLKKVNDDKLDIVDLDFIEPSTEKNKQEYFKSILMGDESYKENHTHHQLNLVDDEYELMNDRKNLLIAKLSFYKRKISDLNNRITLFSDKRMILYKDKYFEVSILLEELLNLKTQIENCNYILRANSSRKNENLILIEDSISIIEKKYYDIKNKFEDISFSNID